MEGAAVYFGQAATVVPKAFLCLTWRVVVKDYPKNAVVYLMCVKISAVMLMEAACFFPFMIKEESVLKS